MCEAFGVRDNSVYPAFQSALERDIAVYSFDYVADGTVRVQDISELDPGSENPAESGWGGLTGVSSRIADAVASVPATATFTF